MPFNTLAVGAAVTPTVIETSISHYSNRKPLRNKPTAHITYHVGLNLIRRFLTFASHHTVDEIQAFTSQWVPVPRWIKAEDINISETHIQSAATAIQNQLGPAGIELVGGKTWWQWRRESKPLKAEWIEMRKDYNARKAHNEESKRNMLYVHGGAYFFGSVDEHRYQVQRHARKLQARVLAPRYRLAPQFPFPCGLLDCLATYLEMLETCPPETIILAGDSAGGGMVLSMLVILRDQGIPLPAGAILLSPWVDLTHSFPSVAKPGDMDYVPPHGFMHRPSMSWPPPNSDLLVKLERARSKTGDVLSKTKTEEEVAAQGFSTKPAEGGEVLASGPKDMLGNQNLSISIDGKVVELKDQIQMYTTNALLSHPLVSPVLQPSLGGLPPLCVIVGGGEMLRDEQIYLAHKAADPSAYPPSSAALEAQGASKADITKYPPTNVQLQVWDDMCHVAPTLSFTRPAKYMYRSVAQFGAWALARAQKSEIRIVDDDEVSVISSRSSSSSSNGASSRVETKSTTKTTEGANGSDRQNTILASVGKAGDALPRFKDHMIRQRVTRHGEIYTLPEPSDLPACKMQPADVGTIKEGPVRTWMAASQEWGRKYAKEKLRVQNRRMKEMSKDMYEVFPGETPPPTALAGRRKKNYKPKVETQKKSKGLMMWSGWGSKHDESTLEREKEKEGKIEKKTVVADKEKGHAKPSDAAEDSAQTNGDKEVEANRPNLRTRAVSDEGQTDENQPQPLVFEKDQAKNESIINPATTTNIEDQPIEPIEPAASSSALLSPPGRANRPMIDGAALPFKLRTEEMPDNASTMTLTDAAGVIGENRTVAARPELGGHLFPFKLGAHVGERTASTTTLQEHEGIIGPNRVGTPASSVMGVGAVPTSMPTSMPTSVPQTAGPSSSNSGVSTPMDENGRPTLERFVTASDMIP